MRECRDLCADGFLKTQHLDCDGLRIADHPLQLVLGALCDLSALVHDRNARADLLDLLHIMRGVNDGRAVPVQLLNPLEDLVPALRIDRDGRLIQNDELRLMRDAAGDIQTPEQTAGELLRAEFQKVLQPDKLHGFFDILLPLFLVADVQPAEVVDVFVDGQFVKHCDVLHDDADVLLDVVSVGCHLFAEDLDFAFVMGEQGQQAVDGGRFAGAVRSQQSENFALADFKTEMIQRDQIAVALDKIVDFDNGMFHGTSSLMLML